MNLKLSLGSAAAALALLAGAANATTYTGMRTFDGATVDLSITTDGATGVLSTGDITGFDISITDSAGMVELTPGDSQVLVTGSALSATATDLSFDFSAGSGILLFEAATIGDSGPFYCADAGGTCDPAFTIGEQASTQYGESPLSSVGQSGVQVLATAGGVPEPATWGLMLAGFGLIGFALRSRKQATASV